MTDGFGKWKTMTSDYDYDQLGNRFNCGSGFLRIIEWFHRNGVRLRALAAVQMAGVFFEAFGEASEMEGGVCFQAGLWKEIVVRWRHGGGRRSTLQRRPGSPLVWFARNFRWEKRVPSSAAGEVKASVDL